ncbi:MAG: NAD(P)/FAD-dependent oxidoreductase [Myxococcaceae bacterium]
MLLRATMAAHRFDVVVIGGGHNGLVSAGLLAKRGLKVAVLEKKDVTGGAAITEQPWGPSYKVTALSYVVSLLPPAILQELELHRFGYKVYPQHGYFAPQSDGRYLQMFEDPAKRREQLGKFSSKDAAALDRWDAWLGNLAKVLGPMLSAVPPRFGSKKLGDLLDQASFAWRMRGLEPSQVADLTRLMTLSVADLLDEYFESPQLQGVLAVSGIIGTWAGPRSPGTAFVMSHHKIGDLGDGQPTGAWGFPEGGMGAVTKAMRLAAEGFGAKVFTNAPVAKIKVSDGRATGVVLENGDEFDAETLIATTHPRVTFLQQLERSQLPEDFVAAIERWRSRSGVVKVNLALDRLPEFKSKPGFDPEVHGGTIVFAESIDEIETAFQDAVAGRAAVRPFADVCIPSVFDKTLAPEGQHIMSMFTQWVPHAWAKEPKPAELDAYADRVIDRMESYAPGFKSSILHRWVLGPHEMEQRYGLLGGNIFHGELSASQLFHLRPAPGYADFRTPIRGLYQASSATHGGGGVTGIPALQVTKAILADGVKP